MRRVQTRRRLLTTLALAGAVAVLRAPPAPATDGALETTTLRLPKTPAISGNFVHAHPVATKRALRAILKAADLCVTNPAGVARRLVDGGFTSRYDYALGSLRGIPYDKWREYDAEDTLRFYALRLHEAGMIKSSPNKIIADSADWRFLDELKRELKA